MKYTKEEIITAARYTAIGETLLVDLFNKIDELRNERGKNKEKTTTDDIVISELPKIKQSEFNTLATRVLENIATSYSQSWHSRRLKYEEFPDESVCNKCTGCGEFKAANGDILECRQHYSEDDAYCYHRYQDAEEFGKEVETELENIYGLIGIEIVADNIFEQSIMMDREDYPEL